MAIIVCACGRQVTTQPGWAGQWIACPGCAGSLYAPFPGDKPSVPAAAPSPAKLCALCAETIPATEVRCRYCGGNPTGARPAPSAPASTDDGVPVLIVGLVGIMLCQLAAPVAWVMGSSYEARCRARGQAPSGAGHAGKIVGIVGTVMLALGFAWMALSLVMKCR